MTSLSRYIPILRKLINDAHDMEIWSFEDASLARLKVTLLLDARSLKDSLAEIVDSVAELTGRHEGQNDAPSKQGQNRELLEELDSICFIAKMEMSNLEQLLRQMEQEDRRWQVLSVCDRSLGTCGRIASAIEAIICSHFGRNSKNRASERTATAIHVRRAYTRFIGEVVALTEDESDMIARNVAKIAKSFAGLVGSEEYRLMRAHDRWQIVELQDRILRWLRSEATDLEGGRSLLQAIGASAPLLADINNRSELIAWDQFTIGHLIETIRYADMEQLVSDEILNRAGTLLGRDSKLDSLLEGEERPTVVKLLAALIHCREQMGHICQSASSAHSLSGLEPAVFAKDKTPEKSENAACEALDHPVP